jgi:hypothetical protein
MREWDIAAGIKVSYADDGVPQVQPDSYGEDEAGLIPYELHHFSGFFGLPHEGERGTNLVPISNKCGKFLTAWSNDRGHAFPLGDSRMTDKLPRVTNGGAMMYGGKKALPAFTSIDGTSGSFQVYVPYQFSGETADATPSKAMAIGINVRAAGAESIEIVHGSGLAITMSAADSAITIKNASGSAFIVINDDGVTVNGATILGAPQGAKALAYGDIVEQLVNGLLAMIQAGFAVTLPPTVATQATAPLVAPLQLLLQQLKTKDVTAT